MKFNRFRSKLKLLCTIFIEAPKEWTLPKKSEVLIFDTLSLEPLAPYLIKYRVVTMAVRGEVINVPCFLRSALTLKFWKGNLLSAYTEKFIEVVSPRLIITFVDNNESFYNISKRFPDIKTMFIQNGVRGEPGDVFERLVKSENYYVDHMLVFGVVIGKKYKSYIGGSTLAIGSLKNNTVKINDIVSDGSILFISQYREKPKNNAPFAHLANGEPFCHDQFYLAEVIALRFLSSWCVENKKSLKIAGASAEKTGPEIDFFKAILSGCEWEYLPQIDQYNSYKLVDAAEIVVFIESTLGYESIVRGKKTAAFSFRGSSILNPKALYPFGWPLELPNNGPFWTNHQDEVHFQRIMNYLNTVSDEDWEQTRQKYVSELIEFNPDNTRLVTLLDQLLHK